MRVLKKLKIELFYDPAIPLLGIYSKGMKSGEPAALFTIAHIWKQPEYLYKDE